MTRVVPDNFPRSINQYVPKMEFAADVIDGVHIVSLGSPKTLDPDGILDGGTIGAGSAVTFDSDDWETTFDGSSTSLTSVPGMLDAKYGRCLTCTGDSSTDETILITGRDYLGQKMIESFTLSDALVIYGNKAFKYVDGIAVSSSSGGTFVDIGWYDKLGLPYMAEELLGLTEDNVRREIEQVQLPFYVNNTDYAAGTNTFLTSPVDGFVVGIDTTVTVGTTTTGIHTIELDGTDIVGLSLTIAGASSEGDQDSATPTDIEAETNLVAQYDNIEIEWASQPTAGAVTGVITINPVNFFAGVSTDPQTGTTIDPRGAIQPYTACDGSVAYEVRYTVNAGNLHGVSQYNG